MARYLILHGKTQERIELTGPILNVGRGAEADIRIDDASVSRNHARLLVGSTRCSVEDLGSSNGTFVAGQRVRGEVVLTSGAEVHFGSVPAVYVDDAEVQTGGATAAARPVSLQGILEGDVSLDESLKTLSIGFGKERQKGMDWRVKLVALVTGTILLGLLAVGGVLIIQQRGAWLTRAVLELRSFAAENSVGLSLNETQLLGDRSVAGDRRVYDPVVLDPDGVVLWSGGSSREIPGQTWSGWPQRRPSSRDATVLAPAPMSPSDRPRVVLPVVSGGQLLGWVAAGWDRGEAREAGGLIGIVLAVGVFLALLAYFVLEGSTAWVTRPVRRLAAEIKGLRRDEALTFEAPGGVPELRELTHAVRVALAAAGSSELPGEARSSRDIPRIAAGVGVPLLLLDASYRVLDANVEARRLLGLDPAQEGIHLGRALHGSYAGTEILQLLKRCRPGEIARADVEIGSSGGRAIRAQAYARRPKETASFAASLALVPTGEVSP